MEVDGPVDADLPCRPEDHQRRRARGRSARRRLSMDHLPRHQVPPPRPRDHLRRRPGGHRRRPRTLDRTAEHLHLPHVRSGSLRPGHHDEPRPVPRRRDLGLPGHPGAPQEGGSPVTGAPTTALPVETPQRKPRVRVGDRHGPWRRLQPVVALLAVVALIGVPLWIVVVTAGKSQGEALNPDLTLPSTWHFGPNFSEVWQQGRVPMAFFGSLLIMVPAVIGVLVLGSLASWILARRKSKAMAVLYALAISGIVLPPAVVTIVLLLRQLGLAGTAIGMIGVYMGMYMSTVIFFVTGFVRTVPIELEEAARIDGAGPVRVFRTMILPLLVPVLSTATILICLYVWNDVFYAFFVVGGRLDTLPLNLFQVASAGLYLNNWHLIFAYVILMSLPLLIVFTFAQRRIISGITSGAVK